MIQTEDNIRHSKQLNQNSQPQIIEQHSNKLNGNVVKRYRKGEFLGKGGFARCYQIQNLENKKISAIKIVCKETLKKAKAKQKVLELQFSQLITQIKIHKSLSHKNVVSFDHVFEDSKNVYIVLQLCNNHTLNQMLKKRKHISELQVQYFIVQVIEGLKYLQNNKVIHRDIKLGNLMINENMEVKIGDFGLAAKLEFNTQKRKTICGTPNYLAPEIIDGKGHSYEVDIWSLGVIMYALLFGRPPFQTNDVKKTYKRIKECQYTFNQDLNISHNAKNLISRLLIVDPSKRLTLQQILCHPFLNSNKIPKNMPVSCLSSPLPKNFIEQYTFYSGNLGTNKLHNSMKALQKVQNDYQKSKLQKGVSQRLLLRSSTGFNRNLFSKSKEEFQLLQQQSSNLLLQKPSLMSNNFFNNKQQIPNTQKERLSVNKTTQIFVKKWVDYSSKYGLGYLLSDGSTGIYFNDTTKMTLDNKGQKIDYVTNDADEDKKLITLNSAEGCLDRQINKKITLMQYFRKYLNGGCQSQEQKMSSKQKQKYPFIYIKKWIKSEEGILFRLNNKMIQVNFNDKSQIMIYYETSIIVYCGSKYSNSNNLSTSGSTTNTTKTNINSANSEKIILSLDSYRQQIKKYHQFGVKMQQVKNMLKKMGTNEANQNVLIKNANQMKMSGIDSKTLSLNGSNPPFQIETIVV